MATKTSLKRKKAVSQLIIHAVLIAIIIIWSIPTIGVLITSIRPADEVSRTGWWRVFNRETGGVTLDNYRQVLAGKDFTFVNSEGETVRASGDNMLSAFLNSLTVTIPA
ncbi:MAG: carbohydrate ABC transporter permease, partial [Spirochaetota bacterium]